ncbi:peptide ABC transporter substrate-binding protein [Fusicatenibacter faecihominis]|uniref:Peptide ABC transporter substrate-binding protein n=1 Tax=Fusicatenibacter faecihominis TaxID=2881276 RepID=A0AAE3DTQ3_9FIRM|nr:peptide ABC transporter substrate-binding protein [Fusicatenibacter faecihominis]MCC2190477.1 peptide ABC transporter substrate-binding protein [Fusicatenibacter faecihominis]
MKKKLVSILLAVATVAGTCGAPAMAVFAEEGTETVAETEAVEDAEEENADDADAEDADAEDADEEDDDEDDVSDEYTTASEELYNSELGEFYSLYSDAKEETNVSKRYAMMALAEGKLMESAVMLPTKTSGGDYRLSRMAPHTTDYSLWGTDEYRIHQALIATDFIKAEDIAALREKWAELKGTGTYEAEAKKYLEEKGYTLKDEYNYRYTADPATWDILASSRATESRPLVNTFDGLMEYDSEGVQQPALAESYEVSEDGLTYTFHLRQGLEWVDSQGRKVADLTADDFVTGMQHMMDAQGGLEYLIEGVIKNASQYISGEVTDFAEVGVKAVDDYTVEYTLEEPCTYFNTMLSYSIFAPMSRAFYESEGGKFGAEYDSSASDYLYGKGPDSIAYCGPYVVTNATEKNTIVFKANESYWNKDNINIKTMNWLYDDASDVTKWYNDAKSGTVDWIALSPSTTVTAKNDDLFDTYAYVSDTDASSFMNFYNLNREAYANVNDNTTGASTKSEEEQARTAAAMKNVHFRRALSFGLDRASYNAQVNGEELKTNSLRNCYVPGNFVSLEEDTTVSINGTDTTFPAGTYFGAIEQAQIDADGVAIKVWDPDGNDGAGSSDGFDGWYNVDNAVAELDTAIEELSADGITIDEENPIYIDMPYASSLEAYSNQANAYKQSIETSLGGKVIVNLVDCVTSDGWYYAGYYTDYGYEANYDVYDVSGWSPDFGDPSTYLDTFLPDYAGYMAKCIGIY